MKSHAQVVVIGGGVVGAQRRLSPDQGRLERRRAARARRSSPRGSTWHAAGGMHTLNGDPNVAKLQQYTINLYKEIEEISGVSCGMHVTGGLNLAGTQGAARLAEDGRGARPLSRHEPRHSLASTKRRKMYPLHREEALCRRDVTIRVEGHLDPWGVTQAYAKCAHHGRAPRSSASDRVVDSTAARRTAAGTCSPRRATSTPSMSSTAAACGRARSGAWSGSNCRSWRWSTTTSSPRTCPSVIDPNVDKFRTSSTSRARSTCARSAAACCIGTYEQACVPWSPSARRRGTSPPEPAAARPRPHRANLEVGVPAFPGARQGRHQASIINGPFTFAPDGNPLIGPVRGLRISGSPAA